MKIRTTEWDAAINQCTVSALARLGHYPIRESEREAWFLSPFRKETQASFKVDKRINRWYDHGEGIGGDLIDLVRRIRRCSYGEALAWLNDGNVETFVRPPRIPKNEEGKIQILESGTLRHPTLIQYLKHRKIPLDLARHFVDEVHFALNDKRFFALGLRNSSGGWELRNKFQKYCASPKAVTHLLSLMRADPKWCRETDILILNSLALLTGSMEVLSNYKCLQLALDNDPAGDRATQGLLEDHPMAIDRRDLYRGYKDLNEKLMGDG